MAMMVFSTSTTRKRSTSKNHTTDLTLSESVMYNDLSTSRIGQVTVAIPDRTAHNNLLVLTL